MNSNRKTLLIVWSILAVFLASGGYQLYRFKQAFGVKDYRVVQILKSKDGRHKAELIRQYSFLDLNFFVQLDGEQIYRSEDFKPNYTIPFRETILWDKSGENLIFEVNGERLYGYNLRAKRKLLDKELLALETQKLKYENFGCFGCWPSLRQD